MLSFPSRPLCVLLTACALLSSVAPARSQLSGESARSAAALTARTALDEVLWDAPGDGSLWVRGEGYKAGFDAGGARFVPFLGSRAPRNFPLALRVAHVAVGGAELDFDAGAAPERAGETVRFRRGAFDELYDVSLAAIEQRFVFEELPARGELVIRVGVTSELAGSESADALEFANELGRVRYGRAIAIDAKGRRIDAPTTLTASGIEMRVPSDFVERAHLPLVVDPVIATFGVEVGATYDTLAGDVAYDATTGRWLVVVEHVFSEEDHDGLWFLLDGDGSLEALGLTDASSASWQAPSVANNGIADQFLIVAAVGSAGTLSDVRGRTLSAASATQGAAFTIGSASGSLNTPDVGGDPYAIGPTYYAVVWENRAETGSSNVLARLVTSTGTLVGGGAAWLDGSDATHDGTPSISKSNDGADWNVVWSRTLGDGTRDVLGARIGWEGSITSPAFVIDAWPTDDGAPSASSCLPGTDRWTCAWQRDDGAQHDVVALALQGTAITGVSYVSAEESAAGSFTLEWDQVEPDVDADAENFVLTYSERFGTSGEDWNVYAATLAQIGGGIVVAEPRRALATSPANERGARVAGRVGSGGAMRREMVVWEALDVAQGDVLAGFYDASAFASVCRPGIDSGVVCPCANTGSPGNGCGNSANSGGALLSGGGDPSLAADTLTLSASGMPASALTIFMHSSAAAAAPAVFGQGVRCAGGIHKRLYVKAASADSASAPGPGDLPVSQRSASLGDPIAYGTLRYHYVYYRDPVVLGGCPSSATYNTTQTVRVTWGP